MKRMTFGLATILVALSAGTALAESGKNQIDQPSANEGMSTGEYGSEKTGSPSESGTNENVQPGPLQDGPADPAAGDDPAARIPTDKNE